jgi:hypothetical protein
MNNYFCNYFSFCLAFGHLMKLNFMSFSKNAVAVHTNLLKVNTKL